MFNHETMRIAYNDPYRRGVMAMDYIKSNQLIEVCPILFLNHGDEIILSNLPIKYRILMLYDKYVMPLGNGVLYSISNLPNACFERSIKNDRVYIISTNDIEGGSEILLDNNIDLNLSNPKYYNEDVVL